MKTTKIILQALIDGKKIHFIPHFDDEHYLMLNKDGNIINRDGNASDYGFGNPEDWEIYHEHFDLKKAVEILKTGDPTIRRKDWKVKRLNSNPHGGIEVYNHYSLGYDPLTIDDILAEDYYIEEPEQNDIESIRRQKWEEGKGADL
jgi:hypothetical protein